MKYYYLPASAIRYDPVTKQEVLTQQFAQMSPVRTSPISIHNFWTNIHCNIVEKQLLADANESFRPRTSPLRANPEPDNRSKGSHQKLCYQQSHHAGLSTTTPANPWQLAWLPRLRTTRTSHDVPASSRSGSTADAHPRHFAMFLPLNGIPARLIATFNHRHHISTRITNRLVAQL